MKKQYIFEQVDSKGNTIGYTKYNTYIKALKMITIDGYYPRWRIRHKGKIIATGKGFK